MTPAQQRLAAMHGTPADFESAVFRAADQMMCTYSEAIAAMDRYLNEWEAAAMDQEGRPSEGGNSTSLAGYPHEQQASPSAPAAPWQHDPASAERVETAPQVNKLSPSPATPLKAEDAPRKSGR